MKWSVIPINNSDIHINNRKDRLISIDLCNKIYNNHIDIKYYHVSNYFFDLSQ